MKEKPIDYDNLPMGSVWDGSPIRRTLNCGGCKYLVQARRGTMDLEICAWGVAWKELQEVSKPRKCLKIGKEPPQRSSLEVIRRINENSN